jgi:hypothetical protein
MTTCNSSFVHSYSTVAIFKKTAVSVHVTRGGNYYCYLVVNMCTNLTHAWPTQCRNPFSGNKIVNLTLRIALVVLVSHKGR